VEPGGRHFYQTRLWFATLTALALLAALGLHRLRLRRLRLRHEELEREVHAALASVKTLRGLLPICANCKRIRSDQGYWEQIEAYVHEHSEAQFSHGFCPDCLKQLYPRYAAGVIESEGRPPATGGTS